MSVKTLKRGLPTIPVKERGEFPIEKRVMPGDITGASTGCTGCASAGCHTSGCPMENNIPEVNEEFERGMKELAQDRAEAADKYFREAFAISWTTNRWGLLTGRLCPSDKLCEDGCIYRDTKQGSILIRGIEYDVHARAWENGWVPPLRQTKNLGKSIAIIGAGFAAIAAAELAFERGYDVTIYERGPTAGGMGAVGIPRLKIAYEDITRYINRLLDAGVKIVTGAAIGADNETSFRALSAAHDAVIIATGKYKPKTAILRENGGDHMIQAIDFLSRQSLKNLGISEEDDAAIDAHGKRVIVIGGGDTAMDCVRTAKTLQGAKSSVCLYRGPEKNLRAGEKEVEAAKEEGVIFEFNASPQRIEQNNDGSYRVYCRDGRTFETDMLISAVGFEPEDLQGHFGEPALPIEKWGTIEVTAPAFIPGTDPFEAGVGTPMAGIAGQYQNDDGQDTLICAAGDIVGSYLAVHALAGGRDIVGIIDDILTNPDTHPYPVKSLNSG